MSEDTENLTLEVLKKLQSRLDGIENELKTVNVQLASMDQHMTGFMLRAEGQSAEIQGLKQRIERIERRLELTD